MKRLLIFFVVIFNIIDKFESRRYQRSSLLEAACIRRPDLRFCKNGLMGRQNNNVERVLSSPSMPPTMPSSSSPSTPILMLTPPPELSVPKSLKLFPFNTGRFAGRLGEGDFDRIDRLEGSKKENGDSTWQKITGKNRDSTELMD